MNAALTAGKKEQVSIVVPADLIHLKLELFLSPWLVCLDVNECHEVFLVADGDRVTVWGPADINVLTYNDTQLHHHRYTKSTLSTCTALHISFYM